jgi:NitT/TauT family transport system ATP-binding protein
MDVRLENVSMIYETRRGPVQALQDFSLEVTSGEFVAIIGPSGCGKSTLLKAAAGLLQPSSGRILLGNEVVTKPRTDIGMMFQSPVLLPWKSVLKNVMLQAEIRRLPREEYLSRARGLLRDVGLTGWDDKYVFELSGGMQQRVSFCRAVLHDPQVLLMDEPFGALDALVREQMAFDLQRMWMALGGQTVLFVTHSIPEAALLADRVVVMSPSPGQIRKILSIDLKRPRTAMTMSTPAFGSAAAELRSLIVDAMPLEGEENRPSSATASASP